MVDRNGHGAVLREGAYDGGRDWRRDGAGEGPYEAERVGARVGAYDGNGVGAGVGTSPAAGHVSREHAYIASGSSRHGPTVRLCFAHTA